MLLTLVLLLFELQAAGPQTAQPYKARLTPEEMRNKQAVVETTAGTFVIDLRPDLAPNHVAYFIKLAGEGAYTRTTFHRVMKMGIIQGGDPISKDPAKTKLYGTGGLGVLNSEFSTEKMTRGTVAAVLQPRRPESGGAQFFVCVTDQPALDGQYTIFGRVSEGLDVVEKISATPVDDNGRTTERVEIISVTIRDTPPPTPEPFSTEAPDVLARHRAVLETSAGSITVEFLADQAPEHVRNFLRLSSAGVYDGTLFHRVVKGFVVQTGSLHTRGPLTEKQQKLVRTLAPEFNDTKHTRGIVSMAHGDDPASASTSFFIVTADAPSLDNKYTVFGRVIGGIEVLAAIESVEVNAEEPVNKIELRTVRIIKP
jgi:cyclophilin family peptidyl-prolyl cis-trans isomerase